MNKFKLIKKLAVATARFSTDFLKKGSFCLKSIDFRAVIYIIIIILLYAFQTTVLSLIAIYGAMPDLVLAFVVCAALVRGEFCGGWVGLVCGILTDVMSYGAFGLFSILYLYTGIGIGLVSKTFYSVRTVVAATFSFSMCFILRFLHYFFGFYIWGKGGLWFALSQEIFPVSIYTAVAAVPMLLFVRYLSKRFSPEEV